MNKLNFPIQINASRSRVWQILWSETGYRTWTSVFSESSHAETDWQEGSRVLFLNGKGSGMVSRIDRKVEDEFMSFQHLGEMKNGVADYSMAEANGWADGRENYLLTENGEGTLLVAELDVPAEFEAYFFETFPKALQLVKKLAETEG